MSKNAESRVLEGQDGDKYIFNRVLLRFADHIDSDVFGLKNNKSLRETLDHPRYKKLAPLALHEYEDSQDVPLGEFLIDLKRKGDPFYRRFLNKNGDYRYSTFAISDESVLSKKGVYAYYVGDQLRYIGRCKDSMKKRVNHGYGKIHPKNCFLDGQSTNCHLNAKITEFRDNVSLWFCPLESDKKIELLETQLIRKYVPTWNIQKY